jgi:hypothetical protein
MSMRRVTVDRHKVRTVRLLQQGLSTALLCAVVLTSCSSGMRLKDGWERMSLCPPEDNPVEVSDLHLDQYSSCNLEGQQLRFPTGDVLEVPPVGNSSRYVTDDYILIYMNLGVEGIFASYVDNSETRLWGTPSTVDAMLEKPETWHDRL